MIIQKINLQNFRNYPKKTFEFSEGVNLIVGNNAAGKTNLLEAIYLLASGRSFRVKSVEREMISYGEEISRVKSTTSIASTTGTTSKRDNSGNSIIQVIRDADSGQALRQAQDVARMTKELEIVLTTGEVGGEKTGKKKYLVDGVAKRAFDFLGNFRAVYFGPEDLELVTDSPSLRRKYLDSVLVQVDREYARCLLAYEKGIRARNRLLETMREEGGEGFIRRPPADRPDSVGTAGETPLLPRYEGYRRRLYFWDQLVIKNGNILTRKRQEYIEFLNGNLLRRPLASAADNTDKLRTDNADTAGDVFSSSNSCFYIEYDRSLISEERLKQYEREEVAAGITLVGPHRDDFIVKITNSKHQITNNVQITNNKFQIDNEGSRDLSVYGSRGEQRLAILWLKLGELAYIEKETGDRPVLLLDDIFSELDEGHRELVMGLIGKQQTIITTADGGIMGEIGGIGVTELK